jgi:hypothetical protein
MERNEIKDMKQGVMGGGGGKAENKEQMQNLLL